MKNPINTVVHHVSQIAAIILAIVWFGWEGGVVAFLLSWATNTSKDA